MSWQDWVFSIGGIVMLLSLLPTIRSDQKPAVATSVTNVVIVTVFGGAFVSMGLWLSVATNVCIAAAWTVLALQRLRQFLRTRPVTQPLRYPEKGDRIRGHLAASRGAAGLSGHSRGLLDLSPVQAKPARFGVLRAGCNKRAAPWGRLF